MGIVWKFPKKYYRSSNQFQNYESGIFWTRLLFVLIWSRQMTNRDSWICSKKVIWPDQNKKSWKNSVFVISKLVDGSHKQDRNYFTLDSANKDLRLFQKTSGDFKSELIDF